MKKSASLIWAIVALVIVLGLIIAGNGGNTDNIDDESDSEEIITIGFLGPLTGDIATIGQGAKAAVEIAVEEINAAGGVDGDNISVIYEDSKCNARDASSAGNKLINVDKVPVIIGAACSSETLAVAPVAEQSKVVMLSYCSSAPTVTNAGDYIFRNYPSDTFQGKYAAELAYGNLTKRKAAVMYCLSDYCTGIKDVFRARFTELNGTIVAEEGYDQTTKDLKTQLTKIKELNPDMIYFIGYTEASVIGIKQMKELGMNISTLGGDAWSDPKIWETAENAGEGMRYTVVKSGSTNTFKEKMKAKTGKNDVTACASQAYDAVKIIASIMEEEEDPAQIKADLYQVKNYNGISGKIGFDANGDLLSAEYETYVVRNRTSVLDY